MTDLSTDKLAEAVDWMKQQCGHPCSPSIECICDGFREALLRPRPAVETAELVERLRTCAKQWRQHAERHTGEPLTVDHAKATAALLDEAAAALSAREAPAADDAAKQEYPRGRVRR